MQAVAERCSAGVAKALLGLTVIPDDLPDVTGSIGPPGDRAGRRRRHANERQRRAHHVVLEAMVDPDVPPLPPHITLEQAKSFGLSLIDEASGSLVREQ